jgi:DNA-binding CsgD family transcriptional regulator
VGILAAFYIFWQFKLNQLPYLKAYAQNILFFNLLVAVQLVSHYLQENFFQNVSSMGTYDLYFITRHTLGYIAAIGVAFTFVKIILGFNGKIMPLLVKIFFFAASLSITLSLGVGASLFLQNKNAAWLISTKDFVNLGLILILVISVIYLFFSKIRSSDKKTKKVAVSFAIFYFVLFFGMIFPILFDFSFEILFTLTLLFCMNLFPFLWFKYFVSVVVNKGFSISLHPNVLKKIVEEFHLTGREKEILELLIKGSSNKQIEKELFISSHTVKNHVYNIYQKLGTKSRGQLIQFISKRSL